MHVVVPYGMCVVLLALTLPLCIGRKRSRQRNLKDGDKDRQCPALSLQIFAYTVDKADAGQGVTYDSSEAVVGPRRAGF
ncbi:hypothetical protein J2X83_004374 [Brevibacillus nitrificans]|nr:hypothetical protein [Brevibacillus nitrificans]